jgi:hypothetical protein
MFESVDMDPEGTGAAERRLAVDRRGRPTPALSRFWLRGQRRGARRDAERWNVYVDRYGRGEWLLIWGILVLSLLDMVFTLFHLGAGGTEANPIMAWVLATGGNSFFGAVKVASTVVGLLVLLLHVRFRKVKALLTFAFILYAGVFVFHVWLTFARA